VETAFADRCSFLPLSFFTSLFGINVREWSGTPENLTIAQMLEIAGKPPQHAPSFLVSTQY
jgi:hypothetical protein